MTKRTLNKVLTLLAETKVEEPDTYLIDAYLIDCLDYEGSYWNEKGVCIDREWLLELKAIDADLGSDIILGSKSRQPQFKRMFDKLVKALSDEDVLCYCLNSGDYSIIEID